MEKINLEIALPLMHIASYHECKESEVTGTDAISFVKEILRDWLVENEFIGHDDPTNIEVIYESD